MREHLWRASFRLAALAAVGLSLSATSLGSCLDVGPGAERIRFEVVSDCGPAGSVIISQGSSSYDCWEWRPVSAEGAGAVGLPDSGHLIEAPPGTEPRTSRGIAAGDFLLAGSVDLPGASPPLSVERVCRFTPVDGGLEVICIGPSDEARCTGTLTRIEEAP